MSFVLEKKYGLAAFEDLGREMITHRPGNWETTSRADALLGGNICSRSTLPETEEGEAATAAQLIVLDATPPTLALGLLLGPVLPSSLTWDF